METTWDFPEERYPRLLRVEGEFVIIEDGDRLRFFSPYMEHDRLGGNIVNLDIENTRRLYDFLKTWLEKKVDGDDSEETPFRYDVDPYGGRYNE